MPNIDSMIPTKSNFLKKEDVGEEGVDLIIKGFDYQEVGQGEEKENKLVVTWTNPNYKRMVVNKENGSRLKMSLKTDDTDQMIGRAVNVYADPFVAFGGKTVGGLRIRAARSITNKPTVRPSKPFAEPQDDGAPTPPLEAYNDESVPF